MGRPIDDDDREQVRTLHAQGASRNRIAKAIRRSPSTVSKIAAAFEPPLVFDRAAEVAASASFVDMGRLGHYMLRGAKEWNQVAVSATLDLVRTSTGQDSRSDDVGGVTHGN